MRLTGLLAILLFLVIVFFAAPAASHAQMASPQSAAKPDAASPPAAAPPVLEPACPSRRLLAPVELEQDGVCYTMRTYVMTREERDSDVTRMVRYTTCLPAWKLQYKTALLESVRPPE